LSKRSGQFTCQQQNLLDLLALAASDGQVSVQNYVKSEKPAVSVYRKIEMRRAVIERMLGR